MFYLVKFFPVHLMSSGTDHSSLAAKAVAIHNQMYANDMNVDAEAHQPSQTLNAHEQVVPKKLKRSTLIGNPPI